MTRREDWMEKLMAAVEVGQSVKFWYGVHDCCLWAAHCVDVMCDTHIARQIVDRFNYHDEDSANAVIEAGGGLQALVTEFLGEPVRAAFAAPGDVVLVRDGVDQAVVGVMIGHNIVAASKDGLLAFPFERGVICWKV